MQQVADVFIARQPIFDRLGRTYAYELLFRNRGADVFDHPDPDEASLKLIDTGFFVLGLEAVTGGKRAFVNFTKHTLVNDYARLIPQRALIVEILETVPRDNEVVDACRGLKRAGHTLALDDATSDVASDRLLALVDIVKVDFLRCTRTERHLIAERLRPRGLKLLAEKVETQAEYQEAMYAGYHYFQGYFFSKPVLVSGRSIPASKLNVLQLLREINQPETDLKQLTAIIQREVGLTLRLLKSVNAAAFGFRQRIVSVNQALLLLGEVGTRKWASVVALADMAPDQPIELVVNSVVRAKFCEQLAAGLRLGDGGQDAFFLGLFSLLDTLLGRPLPEIIETLPLSEEVRAALLGGDNLLRRIFDLVVAYEQGSWDEVARLAESLAVPDVVLREMYLTALAWGNAADGHTTPAD